MVTNTKCTVRGLLLVGALLGTAGAVGAATSASLINSTGHVALGVDTLGQLNAPDTYDLAQNAGGLNYLGISYLATAYPPGSGPGDATAPGCLCEGWGVSATTASGPVSGYANNSAGIGGLTFVSLTTDDDGLTGPGSVATSVTEVSAAAGLKVTQAYAESGATVNAFQNHVTISNNTGATISDVRYVRVMDWDVPPTEFNEFVTMQGTASTVDLEESGNNGFYTADPLYSGVFGGIGAASMLGDEGATLNKDFVKYGPKDHGAYFKFNFGSLANGESKEFDVFYGAGPNEAAALAALGALDTELYSLGYSNNGGPDTGSAVYFFAFKGVGGTIIDPGLPDAGFSLGMMGLGMLALGGVSRLARR